MSRVNHLNQPIGDALPAGWTAPPLPNAQGITGRYVQLEALNPERHAADLFAANMLDETGAGWTYLPNGPFADYAAYLAWMTSTCLGDDPQFYAFVDRQSGKAIGMGSYLRITPDAASIEVGWLRFSPLMQQTPQSSEAMHLMMQHAFGLGYRRYEWKCDALNAPSRRAAERLGFTYEGTFRQATLYRGRNRDTAWFSILDREWPAIQAAHQAWLDPANFDENGRQRRPLGWFMGSRPM
ncbi:GNAT family N-acetyltransferase [Aestuariibius sp. HNIBRBA575]|uniref:GNAT family N-acetyltransferase n=1 Tax=Aestuariibius sp. HNIBRBA575 TaxID=3233343 RepID=UPI0034A480A4